MSWRYDPELDEVFTDPDERRLAAILTSVQAPKVEPDPAFRSQLRREVMAEAWRRAEPRLPWWRRLAAPAPGAWGMATIGAVLIAAAVYLSIHPGGGSQTVVVSYNVGQRVAAVQPLDVSFSQPMDRGSVEQAVQITPATAVTYQWVSDKEVKIAPVAGSFAPNTQYTVMMAPNTARSQAGTMVADTAPAVFTVTATPSPTPSPRVSPTPTPPPMTPHQLGAASAIRPAWTSPTSMVLVNDKGQLEQVDTRDGTATLLGADGVRAFALRPDGAAVLVATASGVAELSLATHASVPVALPDGAPPLALGYTADGHPLVATSTAVIGAAGPARHLDATATAAWPSPRGSSLLYAAAGQLRVVDLGSGKETAWPAALGTPTVLGWSPDDRHVLYATADGLWTAAPDGSTALKIAPDAGVAAADWSGSGTVAFATASALQAVGSDGTAERQLASGSFQVPAWAPDGRSLAYVSAGSAWFGTLSGTPTSPTATLGVDEATATVSGFMQARAAGNAAAAQAFLDAGGQAAYGTGATLVFTGSPALDRWFVVAALPSGNAVTADVRIALADDKGRDVTQLDELLTVVRDASGKALIHGATATPQRPYGKGPEVIGVQAADGTVHVQFDSDLTGASVAGAIVLVDTAGKRVAAGTLNGTREIVLAPASPLAAGTYRLTVLTSLRDKDGRAPVAEFDLEVPLSSTTSPGTPSPSPSPSPTPS